MNLTHTLLNAAANMSHGLGRWMRPSAYSEAAHETLEREVNKEPLTQSDTTPQDRDRIQLIKEARQLHKNYAPVRGAESLVKRHCTPREWRANTGDRDIDAAINDYIFGQMEADRFDLAQEHDAPTLWGTSLVDMGLDGDCFFNLALPPGERMSFIQPIRADLIGSVTGQDRRLNLAPETRPTISGILLDGRGRRRFYQKYIPDRGRQQTFTGYEWERDIPAAQMLHMFDPNHVDSLRGVTHWESAILNLKDIKSIWDFEKKNQEFAASKVGSVHKESGAPVAAKSKAKLNMNPNDGSAEPIQEAKHSHLDYLGTRERVDEYKNTRPNATFVDFTRWLVTTGNWAIDLPYSITYDARGMQGAPLRYELSKASASFRHIKINVLQKRVMDPWKRLKILEGLNAGLIPGLGANDISRLTDLCRGEWTWPEDPTADEKYQSATYLNLYNSGLISGDSVANLKGGTLLEISKERAKETRNAYDLALIEWEDTGRTLPLEFWVDRVLKQGLNGSVPYMGAARKAEAKPSAPSAPLTVPTVEA